MGNKLIGVLVLILRVAHLAGELVRALKQRQPELHITDRDVLCVQIAGLCHDLGHGPFSHMFDGKFIPKARPGFTWKHEDASVKMFNHLVNVNELKSAMKTYKLKLPRDLYFIRELIAGPMDPNVVSSPQWPYRGRPENKSFLYEIVSNTRNAIDVDKWDYFARDCYHLGIKNNFDHGRCLMFARVCEVDGQKQICFRDKEVEDLYDMFYTRICLHRRAYQHKAAKIVETMITDAFLKADEFIEKFEGSKGKKFKLSDTINDMEAYTKVTDDVFEKILNSSSDELKDSREILQDVVCRRIYKCIGQAQPTKPTNVTEVKASWKADLARRDPQDVVLNPEDFIIDVINLDYGMKEENPIDRVRFYSKDDPDKGFQIPQNQVFGFLPEKFTKELIRVYCKKLDRESLKAAKDNFKRWCEDPDNRMFQDEDKNAPKETPVKSSGTT
uniref:deoxynucleoside triphosphate triphosphohydrolase SAMHD1-like n=1 Tax=Gasterosteus aculeatus aculeatus TaxID=481459 RepID=UPI001A996385|nr:deoxynucleoside triphosphate triphosphohydrolase SAMHD1-like [Gasterosteus aculeatus aculeatus]